MKRLFYLILISIFGLTDSYAYQLVERSLDNSTIYPGTVHKYTVSIPDGYDGTEACLYVGLDGILCNAPARIDSLIRIKAIPTMIGVYLQPGVVCDSAGNVIRYNRSNEFDAIDDRFSKFIESELLPDVLETVSPDGIPVKLRPGGENAMIYGLSSGGIAAFVAAWHNPDLFGKVYSGCGTFVPMRGGNELQAIVRKAEPRALRVFLQDGFSDTWNPLFGSWFEANTLMGSALEFAGYDCKFDWAEGGHSVARSSEIFDDVMVWLWKNHPSPAASGKTGNSTLAPLLENGGKWIKGNYTPYSSATDSISAYYPDKSHCVVPVSGSNYLWQYLIDSDGKLYAGQPFYWLHNYKNSTLAIGGMEFDGNGYIWILTDVGIQICDQNGRVRGILNLPEGISNGEIGKSGISLEAGKITILTPSATYTRKLNITPAIPGVRPESQGQG